VGYDFSDVRTAAGVVCCLQAAAVAAALLVEGLAFYKWNSIYVACCCQLGGVDTADQVLFRIPAAVDYLCCIYAVHK
jgi:hypothetical protein